MWAHVRTTMATWGLRKTIAVKMVKKQSDSIPPCTHHFFGETETHTLPERIRTSLLHTISGAVTNLNHRTTNAAILPKDHTSVSHGQPRWAEEETCVESRLVARQSPLHYLLQSLDISSHSWRCSTSLFSGSPCPWYTGLFLCIHTALWIWNISLGKKQSFSLGDFSFESPVELLFKKEHFPSLMFSTLPPSNLFTHHHSPPSYL